VPWDDPDARPVAEGDWLAVSVTFFQGAYLSGDPFQALRAFPPQARAGYSILLFDLRRPEIRSALDRARTIRFRDRAAASPEDQTSS
jgi:hypothetical protein